jgi:hypothetical protein
MLDYEGDPAGGSGPSYLLHIEAMDDTGLTADAFLIVTITDENDPPTFAPTMPHTVYIDENVPDNSPVTTVLGLDVDAGQTIGYSLVTGDANFTIDPATGILNIDASPDFED